jgi:hypothetical protein
VILSPDYFIARRRNCTSNVKFSRRDGHALQKATNQPVEEVESTRVASLT